MKSEKRQRKFHRINYDGKAYLQFFDDRYESCEVENLSLGGMYVKGQLRQPKGKECQIKLFHKDTSGDNSLLATAEVIWKSDEGVGLKFTKMTFENYMLLTTTLINNAEQPAIILYQFPKKAPFEINNN